MKYKITIKNEHETLYDGKLIHLPIKAEKLKEKSVEMFSDDEPCIIHQTYVIQVFCDALLSKFKSRLNEEIDLSEDIKEIDFIDINDLAHAKLILRRK